MRILNRRVLLFAAIPAVGAGLAAAHMRAPAPPDGNYALFAVNELGMHCMQDDSRSSASCLRTTRSARS